MALRQPCGASMNPALQQILLAAPLFVLVFVGYAIMKWGGWNKAGADALAKFVFTIALPAMLFRLMSGFAGLPPVDARLLIAFFGACLIVFVIGRLVSARLFGLDGVSQSLFALGGVFSNNVLLGLPLTHTLLGESAVVSWGRVDGADASAGMQPRGTVLSRSLCHEIGLYEKQASCYFATLSGQATVAGNVFFNMPRAAICFNDDAIGGSLVTRNLVFATCLESQEYGPFNSWGRVPYVINFPNGTASNGAKPQDDEISFNLVVAGGGANSAALDHDDGSSFYFNHHNVHVYGGHKSNFDGHNKRSVGNLMLFPLVYAPQCMRIFPSLPVATADARWAEQFVNNTCILAGAADWYLDLGPDGCAPGAAVASQIVLENNTVLVPPGSNASVRCGGAVLTFEQWMATGSEKGTKLGAVPPTAQIVAWARALLGMAA
jgi:hypothetical protein